VEIREGDALDTLSVDLPETIDLVLLDGAKALYPEILSLVENRLRPGAFIVAPSVPSDTPALSSRANSDGARVLARPVPSLAFHFTRLHRIHLSAAAGKP